MGINIFIAFYMAREPDYNFERIYPFQDGNGRVGRLVALKECLRYGIVPFIIENSQKMFYYRGLSEWQTEMSPTRTVLTK